MTQTATARRRKAAGSRAPATAESEVAAVWVDRSTLKAWDDNPRENDGEPVERVMASIKRFGFGAPIIAREADREVIAGHTRLKAAEALGLDRVPVRFVDLDPAEAHLLALADNRLGEYAEWDLPTLDRVMGDFERDDLDIAGWDRGDLDEIARGLRGRDAVDPPTPDPPANPVTKLGDVWTMGDHRLVCGDALKADLAALPGSAGMVFTDPPYNVNYGGSPNPKYKPRQIKNDHMDEGSWRAFCLAVAQLLAQRCSGCIYVCHASRAMGMEMSVALSGVLHHSATIVWSKDVMVLGRGAYHSQHELIWFGWPEKHDRFFTEDRTHTDVWEIPRPKASEQHPTMKPVDLVVRAIEHASQQGDAVLDPFMGSGTTMMAAEQLERRCYGVELDPAYCDVIVERWQDLTGEKATRGRA